MYRKFTASPAKKEVRPRAPVVEDAGRGAPKVDAAQQTQALFDRAKKSGKAEDWAQYLDAKGLV
jgi:hypothetical protein